MERKNIGAVALVIGALLLSSCGEVGRYQMVVMDRATYVLDTKTGVVFYRQVTKREMYKWDPLNKTAEQDSLTVTVNTK